MREEPQKNPIKKLCYNSVFRFLEHKQAIGVCFSLGNTVSTTRRSPPHKRVSCTGSQPSLSSFLHILWDEPTPTNSRPRKQGSPTHRPTKLPTCSASHLPINLHSWKQHLAALLRNRRTERHKLNRIYAENVNYVGLFEKLHPQSPRVKICKTRATKG